MTALLMYLTGALVMTASCVLYCDTEDYDWRMALDWVLWPVSIPFGMWKARRR